MWATFASGRRLGSIVSFFIPSLGLCNLLFHWKAEQIPFDIRGEHPEDILEMFNFNRTVFWSDIHRWDYSDPNKSNPPHYSLYTGLTLSQYFFLFCYIMLVQIVAIFTVKVLTVDGLKFNDCFELIIHSIENCNIPFPWKDWDEGCGDISFYKTRFEKVNREMKWTMLVNHFTHQMLLVPLVFTGISYRL